MALNLPPLNTKPSFPMKTRSIFRRSPAPCMAGKQSYWESTEAEIGTYLKKAIPIRTPETVYEPMQHLALAAPTTAASALCVAACELIGGDRSQALPAASAIHLMHAAAYTHQHLPLTQSKFKPSIELLTGDGIVPFGFELLGRSMGNHNPDPILRVIIEITQAFGSQGLIDGLHKEEELVDECSRLGFLEYVYRKKYGEIHGCGAACGAILGGGTEQEIQNLRNFGVYAGMVRAMAEMGDDPEIEKIVRKLKGLALKEMEGFHGEKAELISSLVAEPSL